MGKDVSDSDGSGRTPHIKHCYTLPCLFYIVPLE